MPTPALVLITDPTDPAGEVVPAPVETAHVMVDDLGVTRGDGLFESLGLFHGRLLQEGRHLDRLARSAGLLDLPQLDRPLFSQAIRLAVAAYLETAAGAGEVVDEALIKIVVTRGIEEGDGTPTAWVLVFDGGSATFQAQRRDGVRVVSLDRGYRSDVAQTSPWLLQGAKTLSYAVNKAVLREAARRGADQVLFVSSDGYALEGPTSSLIVKEGDRFLTTPTDRGILAGTTQQILFDILGDRSVPTSYELMTLDRVLQADAVWQASSGQLLAPFRSLDGRPLPVDTELTADLNAAIMASGEQL